MKFSARIVKCPVLNIVNQTTFNHVYETPHVVIQNVYIFGRHLIALCTVIRVESSNSSVSSSSRTA